MRDIKFKLVFEHEKTKEIKSKTFTIYEIMHLTVGDMLKFTCNCLDFKLVKKLQFTGLCDKNGKEIYEGDVIISRDDPSVVVWSDDMACYLYENPRWSKNQHGWHLDCDVACEVEVIGNIHEHPHLLK